MTQDNLDPQHKAFITKAISKILTDPDLDSQLSKKAKQRLNQARNESSDLIPLEEVSLEADQ
ncbi:MAG: hypothetical protein ABEJ02_00225 [Candidatus Paceibacteria bacterium]